MRINRSSQVEGAFGVIKQDMDYERVRRKGLENVSCECMLVCLGYNIRKLFTLIVGKGKIDYWIAHDGLEAELPKTPKMEKIIKKTTKKRGCYETLGFATAPFCNLFSGIRNELIPRRARSMQIPQPQVI